MPEPLEHGIDLSCVSHRPGQSTDLEPKRRRAWARLDEDEKRHVIKVYERPPEDWRMPCVEAGGAYERVLYVLAAADAPLTPGEAAYLMLARHYRNADVASVRKQLALAVQRGHARMTRDGRRWLATHEGVERMREIEEDWRAERRRRLMASIGERARGGAGEAPRPQQGASGRGHVQRRPRWPGHGGSRPETARRPHNG